MKIFWFIPTHGDGRYLGTAEGARALNHDYLKQVAQAADSLGYEGVLIPTGRSCEDPWVVAASLLPVTTRLKFLVAVRPGLHQPSLAARMAATFDRLSGGRLLINLVTGGDQTELEGDGVYLDHAARYEQSAEFIRIWREILTRSHDDESFDFEGKHLSVKGAKLLYPPVQKPYPPGVLWRLLAGGARAGRRAARHLPDLGRATGRGRQEGGRRAGPRRALGRTGEVWHPPACDRARDRRRSLASGREPDQPSGRRHRDPGPGRFFSAWTRKGQRRMAALHAGGKKRSRADLEISPNLWAGVGLVRGGAGTALVGDPHTVAARMQEYAALGLDTFVLSGYPHLEEAYRFAELVFPLLPLALREKLAGQQLTGPFGEVVGNNYLPRAFAKLMPTAPVQPIFGHWR